MGEIEFSQLRDIMEKLKAEAGIYLSQDEIDEKRQHMMLIIAIQQYLERYDY